MQEFYEKCTHPVLIQLSYYFCWNKKIRPESYTRNFRVSIFCVENRIFTFSTIRNLSVKSIVIRCSNVWIVYIFPLYFEWFVPRIYCFLKHVNLFKNYIVFWRYSRNKKCDNFMKNTCNIRNFGHRQSWNALTYINLLFFVTHTNEKIYECSAEKQNFIVSRNFENLLSSFNI